MMRQIDLIQIAEFFRHLSKWGLLTFKKKKISWDRVNIVYFGKRKKWEYKIKKKLSKINVKL